MNRHKTSKQFLALFLPVALACTLASCAPKKMVEVPSASRQEPPKQAAATTTESPAPAAPRTETKEAAPPLPPPPGQAGALFTQANKAMEERQTDKAELLLERALRLAPREPQVWHAMAKLRFQQRQYSQAVQFCLKSNSLAGKDTAMCRQNWLLLEKAYLKMGNKEKAANARKQAEG